MRTLKRWSWPLFIKWSHSLKIWVLLLFYVTYYFIINNTLFCVNLSDNTIKIKIPGILISRRLIGNVGISYVTMPKEFEGCLAWRCTKSCQKNVKFSRCSSFLCRDKDRIDRIVDFFQKTMVILSKNPVKITWNMIVQDPKWMKWFYSIRFEMESKKMWSCYRTLKRDFCDF